MDTTSLIEERRAAVRELALKGATRKQIQNTLGISYGTVRTDLRILNIIPVSTRNKKEN